MSEATVNIRQESPRDIPAVRDMLILAFHEPDEADLVDRLRASTAFDPRLSLVAEIAGEIVGHVLFNPVTIKTADAEIAIVSLAPLAVRPDHQREGIGQLLSKRGFEVARDLGYSISIVVGHPTYYPRLGFAQAGPMGIHDPIAHRPEGSMAIALVEGALDGIRGEVIYPPEFEESKGPPPLS